MATKNDILLSICIPTYNRCRYLEELVHLVLSIDRDDIEVVVTDNISTDSTLQMLEGISDSRLRVCRNEKQVPAFCNMINALFNANGKYALYCNDRDLLVPEAIMKTIDVLVDADYSFVSLSVATDVSGDLITYKKGFESLKNQAIIHHPTGLIFNHDLMRKYLKREYYYQYNKNVYTYDFLMYDLLALEKSAIYHVGAWKPRNEEFMRTNKSGTNKVGDMMWFFPQFWPQYARAALGHIYAESYLFLSDSEKADITYKFLVCCMRYIILYKQYLRDPVQSARYGIKVRRVSVFELMHHFVLNYKDGSAFLKEYELPAPVQEAWKRYFFLGGLELILRTFKYDLFVLAQKCRKWHHERKTTARS